MQLSYAKKGSLRETGLPSAFGAGNETRTRDLNLGKVALYQLSYSRMTFISPLFALFATAWFVGRSNQRRPELYTDFKGFIKLR
jgi:hypothetical protein